MEVEKERESGSKTILIFGINSFLGSNLAEFFKRSYRVIGTYHNQKVFIPGLLTVPCDVLKKEDVQRVIFAFRPDIVIYAVGMRSVNDCSEYPDYADALNSSGLFNVAEYAQRYRAQICSLTSHYVFSGENRNYVEMDIPDPETILGKTQSSAEFYIQKTALNYLIFRCCNIYGRGLHSYRENYFETIQRKIFLGDKLELDDSIKSGFLDIVFLATLMKSCFDKKVNNRLFQVCSADSLSFYEFARLYTKIFKEGEGSLQKRAWKFPLEMGLKGAERNLYYQLDSINIESFLNVRMPTVEESLMFTFRRLQGQKEKILRRTKGDGLSYI